MKSQQTDAMKTGASAAPPQFVRRIACACPRRPNFNVGAVSEVPKSRPHNYSLIGLPRTVFLHCRWIRWMSQCLNGSDS